MKTLSQDHLNALLLHDEDYVEEPGIRLSLTAFAGVEKIGKADKAIFFPVVHDALKNIAQQSMASHAEVIIKQLQENVRLTIHDNGNGFRANIDVFFGEQRKRPGLPGMKERPEMIGGLFRVESAPGKGTTSFAEIPNQAPNTREPFQ